MLYLHCSPKLHSAVSSRTTTSFTTISLQSETSGMNLDRMNLQQLWGQHIFQAQRAFKGKDNSTVRFFSYISLTLLTLFFHFLFLCSKEGLIHYVTGHDIEFLCVRKQMPKSRFECYVYYASWDKDIRQEQHNLNIPELRWHFFP